MRTVGTNGADPEHRFALDPPLPAVLADLRTWIRRLMGDLTPGALADLELVCTELATNALEHAAGPRRMRIRRDRKAKAIRVEIDDASPDLLPAIGTSRVNEHRGRGLELVNALAHWGVQRDQRSKTLWAVVPAG